MKNELLVLRDVSASYGGEVVLEGVDLTVREGDFIGIIGPNGGGKTTLLKVILGLLKPVSGSVEYLSARTRPHNIGYLPQLPESDTAFPVSVHDVVLSGLMHERSALARMSMKDKSRADSILEELGILSLRSRNLSDLSGGELQRVYLGRAIIGSPALLLLDEPGNFIDSSFEQGFYDKLKELNKTITILMVSHDVGTISAYVKSFACVNRNLNYHDSDKITSEQLKGYGCPIQLIAHGEIPHTVLEKH